MSGKKAAQKSGDDEPKKLGRPSKYSDALAAEICERLSEGEALAEICRESKMPGVQTVADWQKMDEGFSVSIARARIDGGHAIARRARETARGRGDSTGDYLRDKLIIETDLKLLAKWFPKDYGDRQTLDVKSDGLESFFKSLAPKTGIQNDT